MHSICSALVRDVRIFDVLFDFTLFGVATRFFLCGLVEAPCFFILFFFFSAM